MNDPEVRRVLEFWFADAAQDSPRVDARMDRWFGTDPELDRQIAAGFGELMDAAREGRLDHWADTAEGRLALIILLDQFPRNARRGTPAAFAGDRRALKLCVEGTMSGCYKTLSPIQQLFFFMPLQHAESLKIQDKSTAIYQALAERVSPTLRETFETAAQFAELHRDIVAEFGRFPHRNAVLGRANTAAEDEYLAADAPSFGQ